MAFESLADFLQMGKHGAYVWASYGLSLAVIAANIAAPLLRRRHLQQQIQRKIRRENLDS